jgi:hypothetical protein
MACASALRRVPLPAGINTYTYVLDNPLSGVDPLGLVLVPVTLPGRGDTYLDSSMVGPVTDFSANAAAAGVPITFSSAFRSTDTQGTLNSSNSTTPAAAGTSLHEAGYAVDINWSQVPASQRDAVVKAAAEAGLSWGEFQET